MNKYIIRFYSTDGLVIKTVCASELDTYSWGIRFKRAEDGVWFSSNMHHSYSLIRTDHHIEIRELED